MKREVYLQIQLKYKRHFKCKYRYTDKVNLKIKYKYKYKYVFDKLSQFASPLSSSRHLDMIFPKCAGIPSEYSLAQLLLKYVPLREF